ncbi:hypothetical protein B8A44_08000 [Dolosigranulum pigrum]|uniref:Uncharacterized protein n=1 Tax=Dolosigranulum pigrum TaxID=29394 RepID=A0A328KHF4_9LACT|nr:hypothetical protein [Dolosigranulum pigrum]RAN62206.1 hypothetical protein B8A44_08000 [Dolosigranulum pigrum]
MSDPYDEYLAMKWQYMDDVREEQEYKKTEAVKLLLKVAIDHMSNEELKEVVDEVRVLIEYINRKSTR